MVRALISTLGLIALSVPCVSRCQGQASSPTAEVLALVPPDAIGLVTIQPRVLAQTEALKMMPLEVATAAGLQHLGFDPLKIERLDVIVGLPGPTGPQVAALVSFSEDVPDTVRALYTKDSPKTEQGLELSTIENAPPFVVHMKGPRQAVVGTRAYVLRLLKTTLVDGDLRQQVNRLREPGHVSIVVALEPMRDMLVGLAQAPQLRLEPKLSADVATLASKTKMIALRIQLDSKPLVALAVEAGNETDTIALAESWTRLLKYGAQTLIAKAETDAKNQPGHLPQAMIAYLKRLATEAQRQLTFVRKGNRLLITFDSNQIVVGQIGVMAGLLLPAVQSAREAARRMQSANNLKQIGLAIHNYESAYKFLPSDANPKANDKPANAEAMLSWRVKILPFIEQAALYNEFRHDEPWDSPHNIKLLERMPASFRHPESAAPAGHTIYQMPTGEHLAAEPGRRLRFADFTDGTAKTIAVFESRDDAAVPWTKPGDGDPLTNPEKLRKLEGAFQALFLDGSVQTLSARIPDNIWRALLTRDAAD